MERVASPARLILAVDYGRKRIGLAVADETAGVARPLATIDRKNRRDDLRRLMEIVREHGVRRIVVGHPLRLDGTPGEMAVEAERFAERLRRLIGVPVELVDERLSSWKAEQILAEQRSHRGTENTEKSRRGKRTERQVDAVAAAVILRDYLERKRDAKE